MKKTLLMISLALAPWLTAQDSQPESIETDLRSMFERPDGAPISEAQKKKLGEFLERHAGRDLGEFSYARALHLYLTRDYEAAFVATDEFFTKQESIAIVEHAAMVGRIGMMGMLRSRDAAARARHAERAARLYPEAEMLQRTLPRALRGLDAKDQRVMRLAVVRGVLAGNRSDAERDAMIGAIYGSELAKPAERLLVTVTGSDLMRFDKTKLEAKVGQTLEIEFKNIGKMPVEAMGHNLVILKPGTDAMKFGIAAATAKVTDYIPPAMRDVVVANSKLLGPGESDTVVFTPDVTGDYPFLCSFPGHVALMRGVIKVDR